MHRKSKKVAWMSGLVTGLQNRVQRFESASDLSKNRCLVNAEQRFVVLDTIEKVKVILEEFMGPSDRK